MEKPIEIVLLKQAENFIVEIEEPVERGFSYQCEKPNPEFLAIGLKK